MTRGHHNHATAGTLRPALPRGLLLLSRLWACPRARPLRGDQRPGPAKL